MKLYPLPALGALALAGSQLAGPPAQARPVIAKPVTAPPTSPLSPGLPGSSGQAIYVNSLQNGWQNWSWAQTSLVNKYPALSADSISVVAGPWQAVYLHHPAFGGPAFTALSFWVNGGLQGGQHLVVRAMCSGVPQAPVTLTPLNRRAWQQVVIPLSALGVANAADIDGLCFQNNTPATLPAFYLDKISLSAAPSVPPPAAPAGLAATPAWVTGAGGMGMAQVALAWNAVPGAASYAVYRNGAKVQDGLAAPAWTDMAVTSGQTYSYAVAATGPGGLGPQSAPVSATAPAPPMPKTALTAPVNLTVQGLWEGGPADALAWTPVPGAASYNVYQYGVQVATGLKTAAYAVPQSLYCNGMTYAVTAVDAMGMETLPSAIASSQGMQDPSQQPGWMPDAPPVPTAVVATPEWNNGMPRVHLAWNGNGYDYTYAVYRDGKQVADGLWGLNYYDQSVQPGETHTYTVTGINLPWTTFAESAPSAPAAATAPSAAPTPQAAPVQITGVQANDDSAVISFAAVPGAVDYRVYDAASPNAVKYSGGSLSIELNGLDPAATTNLVVEAVDKLGPFQTSDGMAGPGSMQMDGMHSALNGQGDPSDVPNVLAASAPQPVTCTPRALTGDQAFFDTFRDEPPLVEQPLPAPVPGTWYGTVSAYAAFANSKWTIRDYGGDVKDTQAFFMSDHFMDTLYDGGTPQTNLPVHTSNASLVMMPNATADISGGKVLHVTFEVDAHMDGRRWCDLFVGAAGDTLVDPNKFADFPGRRPTLSGRLFRWEIHSNAHSLSVFPGVKPDAQSDAVWLTNQVSGVGPDSFGICARSGPWCAVPFNGTPGDLDKRHKFDLYLSSDRAVVMEQGYVVKDASFPAGTVLPFDKCQVYLVHQVYHTANDRPENVSAGTDPYWYNNRPWCDERHWDNCGEEVLPAFPAFTKP